MILYKPVRFIPGRNTGQPGLPCPECSSQLWIHGEWCRHYFYQHQYLLPQPGDPVMVDGKEIGTVAEPEGDISGGTRAGHPCLLVNIQHEQDWIPLERLDWRWDS